MWLVAVLERKNKLEDTKRERRGLNRFTQIYTYRTWLALRITSFIPRSYSNRVFNSVSSQLTIRPRQFEAQPSVRRASDSAGCAGKWPQPWPEVTF